MPNYSDWNKIDLHIHSKMSNEVKQNDYQSESYSAEEILEVLTNDENKVGIFSITDHNCINDILYKDIESLIKTDAYKNKIDYVIGAEFDVYDSDIHNDVFHCLCFFDCREIAIIKKAIDEVFDFKKLSERNNKSSYPDIQKIFKIFNQNGIQDILLIPHFNNKSKGLPQNIAIEHLNYLCFNAYEDSNNIANISKSLKAYLEAGYDNFPFAVFSDCHNIQIYPKDKDGKLNASCFMLSDLNYPFNSIKTAFQEPRLRISIDGVNNMRNFVIPDKYISEIVLNGEHLELSPYQNTIIGKFGSGKSLLLEKIKNGISGIMNHQKYSKFFSNTDDFKLIISDQPVNSINEALSVNRNLKKYEFLQQEDYSYKNFLTLEDAKSLFERLNISYNFVKDKIFEFNSESLKKSFNNVNCFIRKNDVINNLNYEKAFASDIFYSISSVINKNNYEDVIDNLEDATKITIDLKEIKIDDTKVFNESDLSILENVTEIIRNKMQKINFIKQLNFEDEIIELINNYNEEYVNNNAKEYKSKFIDDINSFIDVITDFRKECSHFEDIYNKNIYDSSKERTLTPLYGNYKILAEYHELEEYKSITKYMIKDACRKSTLCKSIVYTLCKMDGKFSQNKTSIDFNEIIDKYCSNVNSLFKETKVVYDFLHNENSMLKKSAGEKSSLFINLIFDLIEKDISIGKSILLILDQPESNIDNDNIFKEITIKLKSFKLKYNKLQSIIVTHNANVAITADSENIIIANELIDTVTHKKDFKYSSGCIENKDFIKDVCNIVEGGKAAIEQRTVKYGINIIRKVL